MRRFIIYGAGAVGGVLGAELVGHDVEVVLIARGAHHDAIASQGLTYVSGGGTEVLRIPIVDHPSKIEFRDDDVVVLAMKTQDTVGAIDTLSGVVPDSIAIVCAQNGVANESIALRRFPNVYGVCVMSPNTHISPGVVVSHSWPVAGVLHLGRYPFGLDDLAREIAKTFALTRFESPVRENVQAFKHSKLLTNLGNAVDALIDADEGSNIRAEARAEGIAVLEAADIAYVEESAYRKTHEPIKQAPIEGHQRAGGSSWQSLHRGVGSIETDYLNGEIVLLGRLYGVPTPVNLLLQQLSNEAARLTQPPGSISQREFLTQLESV